MDVTIKIDEKFDNLLDALCVLLTSNGLKDFVKCMVPDNLAGAQIPPPPDDTGLIPNPPDDTQDTGGPPEPGITITPGEFDAAGIPWDARIHGKKKDKLAKTQEWKKIRGVDKALVAQVEAELRQKNPVVVHETAGAAPVITTPPDGAAAALLGKIMGNIALWAGAGTFTIEDVTAELLKLNIPNLAALQGIDENILTVLDYNLGQAWTIKNTPA